MKNKGQYSGLAIADYFIEKALEQNKSITNMAVLKIIYFAHCFAYPELGIKLIEDPFFAWKFGPVEKNTYNEFSSYKWHKIEQISGSTSRELVNIKNNVVVSDFLSKFIPLIDSNPYRLSDQSHVIGGPWYKTNTFEQIDDTLIRQYYDKK